MSQVSMKAVPRSEFGKGAARRARRAGLVPAVIYGHGQEVRHVALPDHELSLALRDAGVVLELDVEGTMSLVAPRDIQRDPVKRVIEHVDLVVVTRAEAAELEQAAAEAEAAQAAELAELAENAADMDTELHNESGAQPAEVADEAEAGTESEA